jgi:hypothetical protein
MSVMPVGQLGVTGSVTTGADSTGATGALGVTTTGALGVTTTGADSTTTGVGATCRGATVTGAVRTVLLGATGASVATGAAIKMLDVDTVAAGTRTLAAEWPVIVAMSNIGSVAPTMVPMIPARRAFMVLSCLCSGVCELDAR